MSNISRGESAAYNLPTVVSVGVAPGETVKVRRSESSDSVYIEAGTVTLLITAGQAAALADEISASAPADD